jgi:hypothetical protein
MFSALVIRVYRYGKDVNALVLAGASNHRRHDEESSRKEIIMVVVGDVTYNCGEFQSDED